MRGLMKAAVALILITVAGCGKDSVLGVQTTTPTGSYVLRTINGSDLPVTIQKAGNDSTQVLSETLVLADGDAFTLSGSLRVTEAGVTATESYALDGTYTVTGTTLILDFSSGLREGGTLSGGTITLASAGFTLVYRR